MADTLVAEGYSAVGYDHVNIDDCWTMKKKRTKNDRRLEADQSRFPHGIKWLSDYVSVVQVFSFHIAEKSNAQYIFSQVHARGLKFGLYAAFGRKTCAGFSGGSLLDDMGMHAQQFAIDWEIDYLKMDSCTSQTHNLEKGSA